MKGQDSRELSALVRLSLPLIAVNLGNMTLGLVDTAIAGRIDALSLAATGLGNTLIGLASIGGMGVILGVDPIAAQAIGAGNPRAARRAMWAGIHVALLTMIPVAACMLALSFSLERFGIQPELAAKAREYVLPRLLQLVPFFLLVACRAYLQAAHFTSPLVLSTIAANIVNAGAAWVLAFGHWGFPRLGVAGLAWATVLCTAIQLSITAIGVRWVSVPDGAESLRRPDRAMLRQAFRVGVPLGLQLLAEIGIFSLVGLMVAGIGTIQTGAHNVALTIASFTFMVPLGISTATSVRVGNAVGRGDTARAREAGFLGIALGGAFMLCSGVVLWLFAAAIARTMTNQPAVADMATTLIRIAAAFQLFDGLQCCGCGALRGAGVTRWAFGANVVGYWILGLPLGLALSCSMGVVGLWWGLTLGLAIVAVAVLYKFAAISRRLIVPLTPSIDSQCASPS
jgi:MATE family multidrug resistance protein